MATGALDANGIWQYGEDDSETTFSGLLNKLGGSTSTTVTRLEELSGLTAAQLATHRANLRVGIVNISPSSVAQAGGSASANTLGQVTFTGVTSLSLNGVFTSAYTSYKIVVNDITNTTTADILFRLRAGSDSAAQYNTGILRVSSNGSYAGFSYNGTTQAYLGVQKTNDSMGATVIDIHSPNLAKKTRATLQTIGHDGSFTSSYTGGFVHEVTTAYDGFTIYPASGAMTGLVQVFGFND